MTIPSTTPRSRLFRCACGLVGKVRPGAFNVICKSCGRVFGPPDPSGLIKKTQEMARRRRQMEKRGERPHDQSD
ncbi:MAG: hypothetical protein D4R73_07045 [Deltaproteobacteria bacterium]|nr:MAG: hypothetical protein D4R73_07045 [Deltaproteobacteria bacterium]